MTARQVTSVVGEFLALARRTPPPYFFWQSPEGDVLMAGGCSHVAEAGDQTDWREWAVGGYRASAEPPVIMLVGFDPDGSGQETFRGAAWQGFPRARFYQPMQALLRRNGRDRRWGDWPGEAVPDNAAAGPDDAEAVTDEAASGMATAGASVSANGEDAADGSSVVMLDSDSEGFLSRVERALGFLREGELEKIVLSRECRLRLPRGFDAGRCLGRMLAHPHTFSVLYSPDGERYFLSATPERLGRIDDGSFETMALAGTAPVPSDRENNEQLHPVSGTGEAASQQRRARLLADAKERAEHGYVVEMIRESVSAFAEEVRVQDTRVLELPHVWHILTRISGRMAPEHGMRQVIAALHPTPAVAGTPRDGAMRRIAALEPFDRGLYAGCVGWMLGDGEGDAAVTIRSALVQGNEAVVWSGAGIVRESDAAAEERETRAKLQTMLDVLGM